MKKMEKETVVLECHACGEKDKHMYRLEEHAYCEACYNEYAIKCDECRHIHHIDNTHELDDCTVLCDDCIDCAVSCDHCSDRVHEQRSFTDGDITICDACFEAHYCYCIHCSTIIHLDHAHYIDGEAFCEECCPMTDILEWDEKPAPIFYGYDEDPLHLGVELEIDGQYPCGPAPETARKIQNAADEVYCKYDGSLNDGFEIVSHPATLKYHMDILPWKRIMYIAREYGYRSHDAGTCGLHVHLSRNAFGVTLDEQEKNIIKLVYIIEKHWNQIKRFTRRTERELNRWARSYLSDTEREKIEEVKGKHLAWRGKAMGKYVAVNLEHSQTVELRLFRGTLNLTTFYATLQFCEALHHVVMHYDIESIRMMTWKTLVHRMLVHAKYSELKEYLKERGLL